MPNMLISQPIFNGRSRVRKFTRGAELIVQYICIVIRKMIREKAPESQLSNCGSSSYLRPQKIRIAKCLTIWVLYFNVCGVIQFDIRPCELKKFLPFDLHIFQSRRNCACNIGQRSYERVFTVLYTVCHHRRREQRRTDDKPQNVKLETFRKQKQLRCKLFSSQDLIKFRIKPPPLSSFQPGLRNSCKNRLPINASQLCCLGLIKPPIRPNLKGRRVLKLLS